MRKIVFSLIIILLGLVSVAQVSGNFVLNQGSRVMFHMESLNRIQSGVKYENYTVLSLTFEDIFPDAPTYTGFALYAKALTSEVNGLSNNIDLNRIKLTCTGEEVVNVTYITDTSHVNSKLSNDPLGKPICWWITTEGVQRSDKVKISYFVEPLVGEESDYYEVDIQLELRSYTTTP